jgi:hypothetical protein
VAAALCRTRTAGLIFSPEEAMAKFHVYLRGIGDHAVVTVESDGPPKLTTSDPWVVIGSSSFRLTEIVAVVAHEDLARLV